MDVGTSNGWGLDDVIPSHKIVEEINRVYPIEPLNPNYTGEVATRWAYKDGSGELGFISSVSEPFCKECSRIRLSVDGKLYNVFLPRKALTFARCFVAALPMKKSKTPSVEFGQLATNTILKFVRKKPSKPEPGSELRCLISGLGLMLTDFP